MITFESLIRAFHEAVLSANDTLTQKNANILTEFFEEDELKPDIKDKLKRLKKSKDRNEINELIDLLNEQFDIEEPTVSKKLKPKMVTIQYPYETPEGAGVHDVHVPLISLVPVSQAGIEEVNIRTELELALKQDKLMVSFPKKEGFVKGDSEGKSISTIDIKLKPTEETDGLKKLIEGYDKVLRAQIPS